MEDQKEMPNIDQLSLNNKKVDLLELKRDFKFALDNDDLLFVEPCYQYNFINNYNILEYCIIKNLSTVFKFYLDNTILMLDNEIDIQKISNLINLSISQKNTLFLENILEKYPNYDLNKPFFNSKSIVDYTHLNLAISEKRMSHLSILIYHGARIDIIYPPDLRTPIHLAVLIRHQGILNILLEHNSSQKIINMSNRQLDTPLHLAIFYEDLAIVKLLVENGANINIKDKSGFTPLDIAKNIKNNYQTYNKLPSNYDYEPEPDYLIIIYYLEQKNAQSTFFLI